MQELAGRGPWGRCAMVTGFCGLLWRRCCKRSARRCCRTACWCARCGCLCFCRRRASRPGVTAAPRPARHDNPETESEAEHGAELLCQADQVALDHHGKVTSLTLEPCRDVSRGDPVVLLGADAKVSCLDNLPTDSEGRPAFCACEYHRAVYGSSQEGRVCSVQGCIGAVRVPGRHPTTLGRSVPRPRGRQASHASPRPATRRPGRGRLNDRTLAHLCRHRPRSLKTWPTLSRSSCRGGRWRKPTAL